MEYLWNDISVSRRLPLWISSLSTVSRLLRVKIRIWTSTPYSWKSSLQTTSLNTLVINRLMNQSDIDVQHLLFTSQDLKNSLIHNAERNNILGIILDRPDLWMNHWKERIAFEMILIRIFLFNGRDQRETKSDLW